MSKSIAENEADAYEAVIVDSTLTVDSEDLLTIPEKTIRLHRFPGAYWTLKTDPLGLGMLQFEFKIFNFPEELQKYCFTEFSVDFGIQPAPEVFQKTSFQSSFISDDLVVDYYCNTSFTANLIISQKNAICSAEFLRKSHQDDVVKMYAEENLVDFTFIVKEKQFKVHKLILAASSAVMRKMFTAEYKEKLTNECEIFDIEGHVFEALICFMYHCAVPSNLASIAHELYEAAHYYEIENLKQICLNELQSKLSPDNALKSYALAFKYDLEELTADAWKVIKRDILKICSENVEPLPLNEVEKILEIRKKKEAEVLKLQTEMEAEILKLQTEMEAEILSKQKKIEAENDESLQKEQEIVSKYTKPGKKAGIKENLV